MSCTRRKRPNMNQEFLTRFAELNNENTTLKGARIFEFLSFFERCKSFINPHVSREVILFDLPKLCFRRQLENSSAVTEVLLSIHQLPKTALPHVVFFLALNTVSNYILPRKTCVAKKREKIRYVTFLSFFLEHCNAQRFIVDGKRITEIVEASDPALYGRLLLFSDPNCVLTLLQHGLRFNQLRDESKIHPIFRYILDFITHFAKGLVHQDLELNYGPQLDLKQYQNLLTNFKLILRSTYNPRVVIFHLAAISEREFKLLIEPINCFLSFLNEGEDINLLAPPSLKHICRYVIRQCLFEKWCLPYGIKYLPVKADLIRYLHLCSD